MNRNRKILLIENNPDFLNITKEALEFAGYEVHGARSINEAKNILNKIPIQLIVTDLRAENDTDLMDKSGLVFAQTVAPTIPKIILTAHPSVDSVKDALKSTSAGVPPPAVDFVSKKEGLRKLLEAVEKAFKTYVRPNYLQFKLGGALTDQDAVSYITRQAEEKVITYLKEMEYILIIEPRQQGKTSLINFLMRHPELTNQIFVYIDTGSADRTNQKNWYAFLCDRIINQLNVIIPHVPWPKIPNNSSEWRNFLFELARIVRGEDRYLIIALDEIGISFPSETSFFGVLRDIYNSRQIEPQFNYLTFILLGAFHPRDLINDEKRSPFNIAKRIRLGDFTPTQIRYLVSKITSSDEYIDKLAKRIYEWTGGQPYLTQQLCAYLENDATIDDVDAAVRKLKQEDENHLPPILKRLQRDVLLLNYLNRVVAGDKIEYFPGGSKLQRKLELLGLIKPDSEGYCAIRNEIYKNILLTINEFTLVVNSKLQRQVNITSLRNFISFHFARLYPFQVV